MRARVWRPVILAACILGTSASVTAASKDAPATRLQQEIDALVAQLESVTTRGAKKMRSGPTRLDGIAWESPEGLAVGTSTLGAYLNRQVGEVYRRKHPDTLSDGAVGARGILGTLLGGAFRPVAGGIRLTLQLIDEVTDKKLSEVSKVLGFDLFPASVLEGIEPPDSGNLLSLGKLVEQTIGSSESAFGLRVWTDRGKHAAYVEGEALSVFVETDRDCHVRLYHVSWKNRRMMLIHPNQYDHDDAVQAGVVRRFPSDPETAVFEVSPPYGVDVIVAVASETRFADEEVLASEWMGSEEAMAEEAPTAEEGRIAEEELTDDGLEYEDGYLVENEVDEETVHAVLERGLVVRPGNKRHNSIVAAQLTGNNGAIARASCYFATVKKLF